MNDFVEKIEKSIQRLNNKENKIYFLTQNTKGNVKGGVRFIYNIANVLFENNYDVTILHEDEDYKNLSEQLHSDYSDIPHMCITNPDLKVSPEDTIIVPEIFGYVMEQISNLPCEKIILCQAYDHIFETLKPGATWNELGFGRVITTSNRQEELVSSIMRNNKYDIIEPVISEVFTKKSTPSKPIISILTRDQRDTMKIIKTFYIKYPQFRWITFRDMRGLSEEEFANYLKDSFVSVWIDDISGFGTFPIESMSVGTPVIGKVPNLKPEWLNEENGIWTYENNDIVDIISEFTQNWLEDNISDSLYENGFETSEKYKEYDKFSETVLTYFDELNKGKIDLFTKKLESIEV